MKLRNPLRASSICCAANVLAVLLATGGCGPEGVADVSPESAAADTLTKFDINSDGSLDKTELEKCPPLASNWAAFDSNSDQQLSSDELTAGFRQVFMPGKSLAEITCTVLLDGRPLSDAVVRLRPLESLGTAIAEAEATTDASGVAHPTMAKDKLPAEYNTLALVYPGFYYVEVTHPQQSIPPRYNTATELGWQVDPSDRAGTSARFDLKSK